MYYLMKNTSFLQLEGPLEDRASFLTYFHQDVGDISSNSKSLLAPYSSVILIL